MGKYDSQVAYLKENPDKIFEQWYTGRGLFSFRVLPATHGFEATRGCVTMIRNPSNFIDKAHPVISPIYNDERIPCTAEYDDNNQLLTADHLDILVEHAERLDEAGMVAING